MNTPSQRTALKDARHESVLFRSRAIAGFLLTALPNWTGRRRSAAAVEPSRRIHRALDSNRISIRTIVASRGLIYDRNGVLLADNVAAFRSKSCPSRSRT
jgi:penicillin-binding protein 2